MESLLGFKGRKVTLVSLEENLPDLRGVLQDANETYVYILTESRESIAFVPWSSIRVLYVDK